MPPMGLFWCPEGPRRMPKMVPRSLLGDHTGWLGINFIWILGSFSQLNSYFLFLFVRNWFLIAFCKKNNKKETSRTLKSIENQWETKVFQGFPEISVFRILMFSGAFFLFKMLPTVLFWCPKGPRMRPKGIPRGCIGRSYWLIESSYCFYFWFLKQSGHIFVKILVKYWQLLTFHRKT